MEEEKCETPGRLAAKHGGEAKAVVCKTRSSDAAGRAVRRKKAAGSKTDFEHAAFTSSVGKRRN